jgi:glycosyltransferase involved in cell wall biosynthesis
MAVGVKRRLALIGPVYPFRGGIAHYTTLLHRTLRERGHEVLLVSFSRQYPRWLFPGRSDRDPSQTPLRVEEAGYWIDSLNPLTWLSAFLRVRRYRPDMIVLQWWTTFWAPVWSVLGALNHLLLRRPVLAVCHNVLPHEVRWWDLWLARMALRWSTRFIVQSAEEQHQLQELLPDAEATIFPLPVFDMFSDGRLPREEARGRLGLPTNVPVLLFFGIVREYKGLGDLLLALPDIQVQLGDVILLVAGEFWEEKQVYTDAIEELGIGGSVVIDDRYIPNEEIALYFSAADVLVAPYRRVTGSAVTKMAASFGLPVVTTWAGGEGRGARGDELVAPGDAKALADAVVRRLTLGSEPRPAVEPVGVSWAQLADLVESIIEDLAGGAV